MSGPQGHDLLLRNINNNNNGNGSGVSLSGLLGNARILSSSSLTNNSRRSRGGSSGNNVMSRLRSNRNRHAGNDNRNEEWDVFEFE